MILTEVVKREWNKLGLIPKNIDEYGWVDHYYLTMEFCLENAQLIYSQNNEDVIKVRPKSLQGIENNNGWIKINSFSDLPKNINKQYCVGRLDKDGNFENETILGDIFYVEDCFKNKIATHYRTLDKFKKAIW